MRFVPKKGLPSVCEKTKLAFTNATMDFNVLVNSKTAPTKNRSAEAPIEPRALPRCAFCEQFCERPGRAFKHGGRGFTVFAVCSFCPTKCRFASAD